MFVLSLKLRFGRFVGGLGGVFFLFLGNNVTTFSN